MKTTLLLAATMEPIRVISWERAVTLWFQSKVDILEVYENDIIGSQTLTMNRPAVIKLTRYVNRYRQGHAKFSRKNVYARDNYRCQYCEEMFAPKDLTFDHVIPRSLGGKTTWQNVVASCVPCNLKKGNKTPEQARLTLRKKPQQPSWFPRPLELNGVPAVWMPYLATA